MAPPGRPIECPSGRPGGSPLTESGRPDILVVVLDCGRADDFPGGRHAVTNMPFADRLRHESLWFPEAVSPAPWTVPSHASLFTGLYPWEHGAHAKAALRLPPGIARLPTALQGAGYRTFSLSANHLISPDLGFSDGFDRSAWAGWWEPYYRTRGAGVPPHQYPEPSNGRKADLARLQRGFTWRALKLTSRVVYRYPFLMDSAGRATQRLRRPADRETPGISSWIEPTLDRWIRETPADQPTFTFVNLLETHEPYYSTRQWRDNLAGWIRDGGVRQDHVGWLAGTWTPSADQYARLHELCRRMLAEADRRLESIAEVLRRNGRWDDCVVVVTSDHGQAFGEHDLLFHMLRLEDPMIRVPLWFRRPREPGSAGRAEGWGSLVDVAPTLAADARLTVGFPASGYPVERLRTDARPAPVFSVADGLVWKTIIPEHERGRLSEERKSTFDRILVAAYEGPLKLIYDAADDRSRAFDIRLDPEEHRDLWPERSAELGPLAAEARSIAARMVPGSPVEVADDVEERLRSWGYI